LLQGATHQATEYIEVIVGTVYIVGAGATKALAQNAPLNDDLLREALDLREQDIARRMTKVRRFIFDFYPSAEYNIPALEDVLSQLDLALNEGRPLSSTYTVDKIREIRDGLVYGIAEVLRTSLERDHPSDRSVRPWLNKFVSRLQPDDTFVSLNYDIVLDNAFLSVGRPVNYGVPIRSGMEHCWGSKGWRREPYELFGKACPLYKPHGSLNWLFCRACQKLDVTAGMKSTHNIFSDPGLICPECDSRYEALIVAPTMFKSYSNLVLAEIWRSVEDRLGNAAEVVFIGYSLPDADVHLRCILMRALFRNRNRPSSHGAPAVRVIGYDDRAPEKYCSGPNPTHARYQRLFGEVDFDPTGFVSYLRRDCRTISQPNSPS
jgi:hypothetical protein